MLKAALTQKYSDMQNAVLDIKKSGKDFFVLGGGSNSLVLDDYYDGHVVVTSFMNKLEVNEEDFTDYCWSRY